jgi:dihydroxyacid dehydratase/phosphogluconate dehydratase
VEKKIRGSAEFFAGITGAYPRSMFKSVEYHRHELKKPVIGVVSSWSEMHPGSYLNKELAQFVRKGQRHPERQAAPRGNGQDLRLRGRCDEADHGQIDPSRGHPRNPL